MKRRLPVLLVGAAAAALMSAGLVLAQTAAPQGSTAAPAQPPAADLPPQESVPEVAPQPDAKARPKAGAKAEKDDADADDQDAKPDKKADKDDDGVEAKDGAAPDSSQRQIHPAAEIQALDKITAETLRFEVRAGQSVRWKGLVFTLRSCETSAPDEQVKDSFAYLQVRSDPHAQAVEAAREIFRGWMFASSPGLNPLKHPVYDAWLIKCRA